MPDGVQNSHSVFKMEHLELAINLACDCNLSTRDITTLRERVNREGVSFLTIVLPRLSSALLEGISRGRFTTPNGFKAIRCSPIPVFMQDLFLKVFDSQGLYLGDQASDEAVRDIYQFSGFFYKAKAGFTSDQIETFSDRFIATDAELADHCFNDDDAVLRYARNLITNILGSFDPLNMVCKDGPGTTSNCDIVEKTTKRISSMRCTDWKYQSLFFANDDHEIDSVDQWPDRSAPFEEQISKVIFVEKDSRGPRVISAEPRECQWFQQGIRRFMYDSVDRSHLVKGEIQFSDQTQNGALALEASVSKKYATLDLKEASDRISIRLVESLFQGVPLLLEYMMVSRSDKAALPDGRIVTLNKFAPMGSAICFPVLSLAVWSLSKAIIALTTQNDFDEYIQENPDTGVYVYGDDIIVDSFYAIDVISTLEKYGLLVNKSKSFIHSDFAESCGVDAYKGRKITPVRLREFLYKKPLKKKGKSLPDIRMASHVETCNQLAHEGRYGAALYLANLIESNHGALPLGNPFDDFLCFHRGTILDRLCERETPRKIGYWRVESVKTTNPAETGWSHFQRTIRSLGNHAELPDFGTYDKYRSAYIARCQRPKVSYDYPPNKWLP